jgi:hypothetical protein
MSMKTVLRIMVGIIIILDLITIYQTNQLNKVLKQYQIENNRIRANK